MKPYYQDAAVTLYHGDCREVLPLLSEQSVDLIVTDPPYGVSWSSGHGSMGGLEGDDGSLDVLRCLRLAVKSLRLNRHLYVFGPSDLTDLTVGATAELIWDKCKLSGGNLGLPWGPAHERIAFAVWNPYPSMRGTGGLSARLRRGSVISVPKTNNGRGALVHPTEKPVMLLRHLIEASSVIGELVLDPFVGSGSTLVAAQMEGRRAIGIEVDERHCETAAKRLAQGSFALSDTEEGT